jgi:glycosidase
VGSSKLSTLKSRRVRSSPSIRGDTELNLALHSLKTESDYVRQTLADHGNDLLSLGVYGFRIDAAKRAWCITFVQWNRCLLIPFIDIPIEDLRNIISRLNRKPYITSEIIGLANPAPSAYAEIGAASNSDYYGRLLDAFANGKGIDTLKGIENYSMSEPFFRRLPSLLTILHRRPCERQRDGYGYNP